MHSVHYVFLHYAAITSPDGINRLIFVSDIHSVLCEAGTDSLINFKFTKA
jgi:hypothetical protein